MYCKQKSYVFYVEGFDSPDLLKARESAKGFQEIGLELKEIKANKEQIINAVPEIIHGFENEIDDFSIL